MTLPWFLAVFAVGILISLGQGDARGNDSSAGLGCDRPIHLAFYEFGSLYHQGIGIDADLINELTRRTGCKFETQVMPRAEIWKQLESGDLDMTTSGIANEARGQFAFFIPYIGLRNMIVTRAGMAPGIHSLDDVAHHPEWRIGVVKGFQHGPEYDFALQDLINDGRVTSYAGQDALYAALLAGSVQVILSPAVNYFFYLPTKQSMREFALVDSAKGPSIPHSLVFSRKRFTPAMANAWQRVLDQMRLDGTLRKIFGDRLPPDMATALLQY